MKNTFSLGSIFNLYYVGGNCPVQAEGDFLGYYFYFRSRGDRAYIEFTTTKHDWDNDYIIWKDYKLYTTKEEYKAGWISPKLAKWLIFKGCIKFLLFHINHKITKNSVND